MNNTYVHVYSLSLGGPEVRHVEIVSCAGRYSVGYFTAPLCHLADSQAEGIAAVLGAGIIHKAL